MEQYEVVQSIKCRDNAHAYLLWLGEQEHGGELMDITYSKTGKPLVNAQSRRKLRRRESVKNKSTA